MGVKTQAETQTVYRIMLAGVKFIPVVVADIAEQAHVDGFGSPEKGNI